MVVGVSADGQSLTITGASITFDSSYDPTTGIATITITPAGGLGTLPAVLDGQPGQPPIFQVGAVTTLPAGSDATVALTELAPGGAGISNVYQLNFGIPVGPTGASGSNSIFDFIAGGEAALTNAVGLIWNEVTSLFDPVVPAASAAGQVYYASSINSTTGSSAGPRTLTSISVPPQPFPWFPTVSGGCVVTGTVNTQVNVQAFVGSTSGDQVGVGYGVPGTPTQSVALMSGVPAGSASGYGVVAAGTSATIVFAATQVASTSDAWSTASATSTFQVFTTPVQS